jgi:hypothetical protein
MNFAGTALMKATVATVATTATQIVAERKGRRHVTIINHGTADVFIGPDANVTTSTGALLAGTKGTAITIETQGAVYGIVAAATQAVSAIEAYS